MNADVIVIGLGAMGSAACYQLAKRGARVVGIDRYAPPHSFGSTHGETRITRQAIGEGEQFVPFALRSYEIWREIESETGADLLTVTGGLIVSPAGEHTLHGSANFLQTTIDAATKFAIKHRVLTATEINDEFPQFSLTGTEVGYFEYEAGFLRPERCVATQLELAEKLGAELRLNERVTRVEPIGTGVRVVTETGEYLGAKAIISAGPWVNEFGYGAPADQFRIYRQVLHWFDVSQAYEQYRLGEFPIFIWSYGRWPGDFFYGFPAIDGRDGGLKIASEEYRETTVPEQVDRSVGAEEPEDIFRNYVSGRISGVTDRCLKSVVCLYTSTPDSNFVIDWMDAARISVLGTRLQTLGRDRRNARGALVDRAKHDRYFTVYSFLITAQYLGTPFFIRRCYPASVMGDDLPFAGALHPDVRAAKLYVPNALDRPAMGHDRRVPVDQHPVIVRLDHVRVGRHAGEIRGLVLDLALLRCPDVIIGDHSLDGLLIAF